MDRVIPVDLIVKSRIKDFLSENEMRSKPEAIRKINDEVEDLLDEAVSRAKANQRTTVYPQDI